MREAMSKAKSHFLDLPAELRNKIYGYLLSTKYTKVELTYHKQCLSDYVTLFRPPRHYHFHTTILYTNRQIYSEAADIFYRRNLFVSLTCGYDSPTIDFRDLPVVATDSHATSFKHHSLEVHLSPRLSDDKWHLFPYRQVIMAGEDLPHFCNVLPGICLGKNMWMSGNFYVHINVRSIAVTDDKNGSHDTDHPSVKKMLEPFGRLNDMHLLIGGQVTASYKETIEGNAAQESPTATDLLYMSSHRKNEGNEAIRNGKPDIALMQYQSSLNLLRTCYMRFKYNNFTAETAQDLDRQFMVAMDVLLLNLTSLLAGTYLEIGEYAKSYGCKQWLRSMCLWIHSDELISARPDCGRIMLYKALAGKALGQPVQALMDIDDGLRFVPGDEAMKQERKVLCELVRDKMDCDTQIIGASALNVRTAKSKICHRSAVDQNMLRRRQLEALINDDYGAWTLFM